MERSIVWLCSIHSAGTMFLLVSFPVWLQVTTEHEMKFKQEVKGKSEAAALIYPPKVGVELQAQWWVVPCDADLLVHLVDHLILLQFL